MAKDPAFLFYPNDYIGGTMGMTFEEKGAYIELLMMQFNRGHMTSHMIGQTVGQLWENIKQKFIIDENGLYYNVRLEVEQNKRKEYSKSRRNNLEGHNQYTKKKKKEVAHMTSHMEDENEDVIINEDIIYILDNVRNLFEEKYITKQTNKILLSLLKTYNKETIVNTIISAKNDSFWSSQFLSLNKLTNKNKDGVKYIDVFISKFKTENSTALTYEQEIARLNFKDINIKEQVAALKLKYNIR